MTETDERIEAFRRRYEDGDSDWGGHSGGGSSPYWNIEYRAFLERFMVLNDIRSVVDIGCGDWQFSRFINFAGVTYRGYDVVPSVVEANQRRYGSSEVSFQIIPADLSQVPAAELLIMKDVLQHLPDREIHRHRRELFDRFPRCLLSNSYRKLHTGSNFDIPYGEFRCLDLNAEPYRFGGQYVLEFSTPLHEQIRTLLYTPRGG
jgi:SAM-dependent methyltransferase